MTALADARAHLAKAREFLESARSSHELDLSSAATSNAVISGINSKDAICLRLTGVTRKSDPHQEAVAELKSAGPAGKELASTFSRLLKLKTKSQYRSASVAATDATKAIEWAARMLAAADKANSSR